MIAHLQMWTAWLVVYGGMPLAWASFVLHLMTPWRRTEMGRHLLAYAGVIAVLLSFSAVRWWWFRRQPFPDWLSVFQLSMYVLLVAVMAWRIALQYRARRALKSKE